MEDKRKNQNKKKKIISDYNKTANFYDKRYEAIQKEKYKAILNNYRDFNRLILDLGCGTGLFFEYLIKTNVAKNITKSNYIAVDISWNMLLKFKSKTFKDDNFGHLPNFILSDIDHLPFRENTFDMIFTFTSFQNLPSIRNGIEELTRVCKNNTDFVFSILKKNLDLNSLLKILELYVKDIIVIQKEKLEDIIIQGKISQLKTFRPIIYKKT